MDRRHFLFVTCNSVLGATACAADWLQFRGPNGLGIAPDKNLPVTWSPEENVLWKTELPGPGASSPIVVGNRVFVTCYSGYGLDERDPGDMSGLKRNLVCVDRSTGKVAWSHEVQSPLPESPFAGYVALHGYASGTPASDGQNVYAFYGRPGVVAFDLAGKQLWQAEVGTRVHNWGSGTSPVLYKDLVIVNASVESGGLIALNKGDGTVAWRQQGMQASWNTPLLVELTSGKSELVVNVYGRALAFDPQIGAPLWQCQGIQDYVCPSFTAHNGVVYIVGGRANTAMAIRCGGRGDVTSTHAVWRTNRGSNVSSPVYSNGHLYWTSESRGIAYCAKADDGAIVYEERMTPHPDRIYASPVLAEGRLYVVSRTKGTYVLEAKPEFKLVAHNSLGDDSVFNASPAVSDGQIYLRSNRFLYCIAKR